MTGARTIDELSCRKPCGSSSRRQVNQVISMFEATSLVSVIAMADLFYTVQADLQRQF